MNEKILIYLMKGYCNDQWVMEISVALINKLSSLTSVIPP
jgi:hypothetical protein